jgi:hypothetical protein
MQEETERFVMTKRRLVTWLVGCGFLVTGSGLAGCSTQAGTANVAAAIGQAVLTGAVSGLFAPVPVADTSGDIGRGGQ